MEHGKQQVLTDEGLNDCINKCEDPNTILALRELQVFRPIMRALIGFMVADSEEVRNYSLKLLSKELEGIVKKWNG